MDRNRIDLSGKVAIVTGASRGIGAEAARRLAEAGAKVVVNYSRDETGARAVATEIGEDAAVAVKGDIGDPEGVKFLVDRTIERFGRIDIVVNNAAIFQENLFDGDDYDAWRSGWQRTFDVNIFGAANLVFLSLPHMRRQGGGKVINVASRAAWRGETTFADYGASKAALVNLTKSIARGCAEFNVVSTCVAPGFIATEMAAAEIERNGDEIRAQIPLGRVGSVDDVAGVIVFLASHHGDYLTGATIDVNGGSYVR